MGPRPKGAATHQRDGSDGDEAVENTSFLQHLSTTAIQQRKVKEHAQSVSPRKTRRAKPAPEGSLVHMATTSTLVSSHADCIERIPRSHGVTERLHVKILRRPSAYDGVQTLCANEAGAFVLVYLVAQQFDALGLAEQDCVRAWPSTARGQTYTWRPQPRLRVYASFTEEEVHAEAQRLVPLVVLLSLRTSTACWTMCATARCSAGSTGHNGPHVHHCSTRTKTTAASRIT